MLDFKFFFIACFNISVIFSGLWLAAFLLTSSSVFLHFYKFNIGSSPAYRFAEKMSIAKSSSEDNLVTLLGPSTVREGFSAVQMKFKKPTFEYVNIGITSEGSIYHMELLVDLMKRFGVRQKILVLGLNSRQLIDRKNSIRTTRYIDFMSYEQVMTYLSKELKNDQKITLQQIKSINYWPIKRLALRLDYLVLYSLFQIKTLLNVENKIDVKKFSRKEIIKHNSKTYIYMDKEHNPKVLKIQLETLTKLDAFNNDNYGKSEHVQSLIRTIQKAQTIADKVVVVVMPEHSVIREKISPFSDEIFYQTLSSLQGDKLLIMNASALIPDNSIRDMAHLTGRGRKQLSMALLSFMTNEGIYE